MGVKGFEDLREKPNRASVLTRVKAVHSTPDVEFGNEWVSHVGLFTWLEYGV